MIERENKRLWKKIPGFGQSLNRKYFSISWGCLKESYFFYLEPLFRLHLFYIFFLQRREIYSFKFVEAETLRTLTYDLFPSTLTLTILMTSHSSFPVCIIVFLTHGRYPLETKRNESCCCFWCCRLFPHLWRKASASEIGDRLMEHWSSDLVDLGLNPSGCFIVLAYSFIFIHSEFVKPVLSQAAQQWILFLTLERCTSLWDWIKGALHWN